MIISKKESTSFVIGDIESQKFSISTENGVIFDILRNKMYSNKIGAICREISSNSRDANRENNLSNTPIEISIERGGMFSSNHPQIKFKDNGVGITPNRMKNIFLNYGVSTKSNDNNFTGGYGLGAKTPFAYTDTFTVVTVCDYEGLRKKYTYTATITDQGGTGCGEMILFLEEIVNENTGTEIIIPVESRDISTFEHEVVKNTQFWSPQPVLKGFSKTYEEVETVFKTDKFLLVKGGSFANSKVNALVDGIIYPINLGLVNFKRTGIGYSQSILLLFNTGDLSLSSSREDLQYDRKTTTKINWSYSRFFSYLARKVEEQFKDLSILHANVKYNTLKKDENLGNFFSTLRNIGSDVVKKIEKEYKIIGNRGLTTYKTTLTNSFGKSKLDNILSENWNLPFLITEKGKSGAKDKAWLKVYKEFIFIKKLKQPKIVLNESNITVNQNIINSFILGRKNDDEYLEHLGIQVLNYDDIKVEKVKKEPSEKKQASEKFIKAKNFRNSNGLEVYSSDINTKETEVVYLKVGALYRDETDFYDRGKVYLLRKILPTTRFIALSNSRIPSHWVSLEDMWIAKKTETEVLVKDYLSSKVPYLYTKLNFKDEISKLIKTTQEYKDFVSSSFIESEFSHLKRVSDIIEERYPLLKLLDYNCKERGREVDKIQEYVSLIDKV